MARPIWARIISCRSIRSPPTRSRSSAGRPPCASARRRSAAWWRRPTTASRPRFRRAGSAPNFAAPPHRSTTASTARCCSMPAPAISRSMPTPSAAATQDYRVPHYPYLTAPDPADAPNATQPGAFNGRQPNSAARNDGQAVGGSYIFNDGFVGLAVIAEQCALSHPRHRRREHEHPHRRPADQSARPRANGARPMPPSMPSASGAASPTTSTTRSGSPIRPISASDGIRQTFTNKEQEGRVEAQLAPFNLRFATLTTAIGVQGGHQELTAPSPDNAGLWDPNTQQPHRRLHLQRVQVQRDDQGAARRPHRAGQSVGHRPRIRRRPGRYRRRRSRPATRRRAPASA